MPSEATHNRTLIFFLIQQICATLFWSSDMASGYKSFLIRCQINLSTFFFSSLYVTICIEKKCITNSNSNRFLFVYYYLYKRITVAAQLWQTRASCMMSLPLFCVLFIFDWLFVDYYNNYFVCISFFLFSFVTSRSPTCLGRGNVLSSIFLVAIADAVCF